MYIPIYIFTQLSTQDINIQVRLDWLASVRQPVQGFGKQYSYIHTHMNTYVLSV